MSEKELLIRNTVRAVLCISYHFGLNGGLREQIVEVPAHYLLFFIFINLFISIILFII